MTGSPEVKLTPYMGAVVLKVDLQSLAGVIWSTLTQAGGLLSSPGSIVVISAEPSVELSSFPAKNENHVEGVKTSTPKGPKGMERCMLRSLLMLPSHSQNCMQSFSAKCHIMLKAVLQGVRAILRSARCLKITEKVSFNIASYVYKLSRQKGHQKC